MRVTRVAILFFFSVLLFTGSAFAQQPEQVRYASYFGGTNSDGLGGVALGPDGSTYVAFVQASSSSVASRDVRVLKFAPVTRAVVYSFSIGGADGDFPTSIGVAPDGGLWVAGLTLSTDFPRLNPLEPEYTGQGAFLFRLSPAGALTFSTLLPALLDAWNPSNVAVDGDGSVVWAVTSCGSTTTTPGVFQPSHAGACDALVARISAAGSLSAATYLGGSGLDQPTSVALGPDGDIYVGGFTESTDLPTSPGAFQTTPGRRSCGIPRFGEDLCKDGFVGRFSPNLVARRYVSYLREIDPSTTATLGQYDVVLAIAVGPTGDAYVTGATQSGAQFPITPGAYQTTCRFCSPNTVNFGGGIGDIFVTRLNPSGTGLVYSTFLAGTPVTSVGGQTGRAIAVDALGRAYVAGATLSSDFPIVNGSSVGTGVLARFNAQGSVLEYSTRLGGSGSSSSAYSAGLAVDGTVWVGGSTNSTDLATTPDAWQPSYGGGVNDGFLMALSLPDPRMSIDIPGGGNITAPFEIGGWAIDRGASADSGIDAVHVYVYPNPGSGAAPIFLGAAPLGFARSDIAAFFGAQFANAGWLMTVDSLPAGRYLLIAFGHSSVTNTFSVNATREFVLDSRPLMSLDAPAPGTTIAAGARLFVGGWAIDQGAPSGPGIDAVHVWIYPDAGAGTPFFGGVANYGVSRADVGAVYGARFTNSGYELDVNGLTPGTYVVVAFAHSTVTNSFVVMQTRAVTISQ